jgi:hypothetical protein
MKGRFELVYGVACLAIVAACNDRDRAPAEAAVKTADSAVAQLGDDVARFAPDQAKAAVDALAAARGLLAAKDYRRALAGASAVAPKVKEAVAAATARKEELARAWTEASHDVENLVYAVEDRLEALSEAKKLPKGLDPAALVWARETLAAVESSRAKAQEQFQGGDANGAIARAQDAKAQAREVLQRIGMR